MTDPSMLRKLAEQIREEAAQRNTDKRKKTAQIVDAATGLALLRRKFGGGHVA